MKRLELSDAVLLQALEAITTSVAKRLEKHGRGAFVSNHEALGVMVEEYDELLEAVRSNNSVNVAEEFLDMAVTSVIAVASMVAGAEKAQNEQKAASTTEQKYTAVEDAAERARKLMVERAQKSNLVIASTLES